MWPPPYESKLLLPTRPRSNCTMQVKNYMFCNVTYKNIMLLKNEVFDFWIFFIKIKTYISCYLLSNYHSQLKVTWPKTTINLVNNIFQSVLQSCWKCEGLQPNCKWLHLWFVNICSCRGIAAAPGKIWVYWKSSRGIFLLPKEHGFK